MVQLELPHLNVLSKIDLLEKHGRLSFPLEYYATATDLTDLETLLTRTHPKFQSLNQKLCKILESFALVSFQLLDIQDKKSVFKLIKKIDRANGFYYSTGLEPIENENSQLNVTDAEMMVRDYIEIHEHFANEDEMEEWRWSGLPNSDWKHRASYKITW